MSSQQETCQTALDMAGGVRHGEQWKEDLAGSGRIGSAARQDLPYTALAAEQGEGEEASLV